MATKKKAVIHGKLKKMKCLNGRKPIIKVTSKTMSDFHASKSSEEKAKSSISEISVNNGTVEEIASQNNNDKVDDETTKDLVNNNKKTIPNDKKKCLIKLSMKTSQNLIFHQRPPF